MTSLRHYLSAIFVCWCMSIVRTDWLEDLKSGKAIKVSNYVSVRIDEIANSKNTSSYFAAHALRIDLTNMGLTIAKARTKGQDGVQVTFFTSTANHNVQARGEANVLAVFLPLLIGFKIAGTILITLIAVIVVSLKAFLASKAALLLTGSVALKKLWSHEHHAEFHYPGEHSHPYDGYGYPLTSGYSNHFPPTSFEPTNHEAADSNVSQQYISAPAVAKPVSSSNFQAAPTVETHIKRRIFKQTQPRVPILTLRKVTKYESD
ncbi:hypothetical protein CBL_00618 [Carabus blaptoides fortunei]